MLVAAAFPRRCSLLLLRWRRLLVCSSCCHVLPRLSVAMKSTYVVLALVAMIALSFVAATEMEQPAACHPQCRWQCDDPQCPAQCHPVCERPKCQSGHTRTPAGHRHPSAAIAAASRLLISLCSLFFFVRSVLLVQGSLRGDSLRCVQDPLRQASVQRALPEGSVRVD